MPPLELLDCCSTGHDEDLAPAEAAVEDDWPLLEVAVNREATDEECGVFDSS